MEEEERVTSHDSGMGGITHQYKARETRGVILCRCAAEVAIFRYSARSMGVN